MKKKKIQIENLSKRFQNIYISLDNFNNTNQKI